MPKIEIEVRTIGHTSSWTEEYTIDDDNPKNWAEKTIQNYNNTLRAHEKPRELLGVTILDATLKSTEHDWEKSNLVTKTRSNTSPYDTVRCTKCRITGKRFGLSGSITRDSKYRAKKYDECHG